MPYLFLFLSLFSSVLIVLLLKAGDRKKRDSLVIIASNYPMAVALGLGFGDDVRLNLKVLLLAVFLGFLFLAAFLLYGQAIATEGVTPSVTMGRLSLAVPASLSILVWGETPKPYHWPALIMVLIIIFLWEGKGKRISWILLSLFLLFGLIDTGMKFFKSNFPVVNDGSFLTILFASAGVWSWLLLRLRKIKPKMADIGFGMVLGIPNFFSTFFLLLSLKYLPGYLVFPVVNVGAVLMAFLAGAWLFGEKIGRRKIFLMIFGLLAVILLTV